jgi:hypothetical protein
VDQSLIFESPSSPVITSNGADITSAIIWVLEPHRKRGDGLQGVYPPSLIAISAQDMTPLTILYTSSPQDFAYAGGKYNSVVVARGNVFTGTDRITAFGLPPVTGPTLADKNGWTGIWRLFAQRAQ